MAAEGVPGFDPETAGNFEDVSSVTPKSAIAETR